MAGDVFQKDMAENCVKFCLGPPQYEGNSNGPAQDSLVARGYKDEISIAREYCVTFLIRELAELTNRLHCYSQLEEFNMKAWAEHFVF